MAPQVVQITINVTDGNASEAVSQVVAQLKAIGPAGEAGGAAAGAGLDQVGEHALTSLDNVRLLRDDLGVHIPRAMEKAISQSALLSGAIGTMGSGLLALGAVEIFANIGESIYRTYERLLDVNAEIDKYTAKASAAAQVELFDKGGLETRLSMMRDLNAQVDSLEQKKADSPAWWQLAMSGAAPGYAQQGIPAGSFFSAKDGATLAGNMEQQDKNTPASALLTHQLNDDAIHRRETVDLARTDATGKPGVEMSYANQLAAEEQRFVKDLDTILADIHNRAGGQDGNPLKPGDKNFIAIPENDGQAAGAQITAKAQADKQAANITLQRQASDEIISLQNAATNSGLAGVDLLESKREQAIAAYESKYGASMRAVELIDQDYLNQETALWDRQEQEGEKNRQTRLQQEDEALKKSLDEQAEYQDRVNSLMASSAAFELQGYAKLDAEKEKRMSELAKADAKAYSDSGLALDAYNAQAVQVEADADRERLQSHQKTMEEITKEEQQAARASLPPWLEAQQAIRDEEDDRVKQINAAEDQQLAHFAGNAAMTQMIQQETDAQIVAAHQLANAQMQKADEETRDKIATGLQSLFSHPEKFFEETAMKTGFQLMANEMMSVFQSSGSTGGILQYLFGMGPQMNTSTNPISALGSAMQLGSHGGHGGGMAGLTNPSMMQFQQGSTTLLTGSNALVQAATAVAQLGTGGGSGMGLAGMGNGGFGMLGSTTVGGAGMSGASATASLPGMPAFSTGSGMVDGSPMPQAMDDPMAGSLDSSGNWSAAAQSQGGIGAAAGIGGGLLMGATSVYSAYQNSNPIAGAAGGAAGGMEAGSSIGMLAGGPAGALLGGAIGAIAGGVTGLLAGIFGDQGKGQAEGLDVNTIQPELLKEMQGYQNGTMGYSQIESDLNALLRSSQGSTSGWGSGARNYFNSNIQPEINAALLSLQKQEIGGRSAVTLSAGQFHSGGLIGGFGDLATSDTEGFIHAQLGEVVMNPSATAAHAPILQAMNMGTNFGYSSNVQPRMPASSAGAGGNITIQALDSKSFVQWSKAGGGRALVSSMNQAQTQYSGKGR